MAKKNEITEMSVNRRNVLLSWRAGAKSEMKLGQENEAKEAKKNINIFSRNSVFCGLNIPSNEQVQYPLL